MSHEEFAEALRVALRERPAPRDSRLDGALRVGWMTSEFAGQMVNKAFALALLALCLSYVETVGLEALLGLAALVVPMLGERTSQAYTESRTEVKRAQLELAAAVERRNGGAG